MTRLSLAVVALTFVLGAAADADAQEPTPDSSEAMREIRAGRVELAPGIERWIRPEVRRIAFASTFRYWLDGWIAVGVGGRRFVDDDRGTAGRYSVSFGVDLPQNELHSEIHLEVAVTPVDAELRLDTTDFHFDAVFSAGLGALWMRPVPVIDAEVRTFDTDIVPAFHAGIDMRLWPAPFLAITVGVRPYVWIGETETTTVAPGSARMDPATWSESTDHFELAIRGGLTLFLPVTPSWDR